MKITGEAYEFVSKFRFILPRLKATKVKAFSTPLGVKTIEVDYTVFIEPIAPRTINLIKTVPDLERAFSNLAFSCIASREHWKEPTKGSLKTDDMGTAILLADAVTYMVGGTWIITTKHEYYPEKTMYYIWSKGYFHYIGI